MYIRILNNNGRAPSSSGDRARICPSPTTEPAWWFRLRVLRGSGRHTSRNPTTCDVTGEGGTDPQSRKCHSPQERVIWCGFAE